jgi:hypothetical protein
MLIKATSLKGYVLHSLDKDIGKVKEFYFDDRYWAIRYLVADTGDWLNNQQVLISPYAMKGVNRAEESLSIDLTCKQIENSPPLESDKPVSKQYEVSYYNYYGWSMYWDGPHAWGAFPYLERDAFKHRLPEKPQVFWDPSLRSMATVTGYHIQAKDGEIGHIEDFILDDQTWEIRYLIINTQNWWPGKKVLIAPDWIENVSWKESKVFVKVLRDAIKSAPEYFELESFTREDEIELHRHYKSQGYWVDAMSQEHPEHLLNLK